MHTHELGFYPGLLAATAPQRAIFAPECDFLFAQWISVFSHHFFQQTVLRLVQALPTHGLEEEEAPSGMISALFLLPQQASANACGQPLELFCWLTLPEQSLEGLCQTLGRGTPANRGVSVSLDLMLCTLSLPRPEHCRH